LLHQMMEIELEAYYDTSVPEMCAFNPAADADPAIVSPASITCLKSKARIPLAATETLERTSCVPSFMVPVIADAVVFVRTIFVTTVLVEAGVVYNVPSDVARVCLANFLTMFGIIYYLRIA